MFYKTSRFINVYLSGQFVRQKIIVGLLYETFEVQIQEIFFSTFILKVTFAAKLFFVIK